jgi:predicted RNA-binding Zn ribbon-like protein
VPTYTGIRDIPLVAGHPALDLVNTVEPRRPVGDFHEHLAEAGDLLVWAERALLITASEATTEAAAWQAFSERALVSLDGVKAVREALFAVLRGEPGDSGLELLWAQSLVAGERSRLRRSSSSGFELVVGVESGWVVLDRVATAAVDLLTAVDLEPLRACPLEEGGCGWLFLDRSRGRTRRWCVMADCGAKAKSRRLTDRRRAARSS